MFKETDNGYCIWFYKIKIVLLNNEGDRFHSVTLEKFEILGEY